MSSQNVETRMDGNVITMIDESGKEFRAPKEIQKTFNRMRDKRYRYLEKLEHDFINESLLFYFSSKNVDPYVNRPNKIVKFDIESKAFSIEDSVG